MTAPGAIEPSPRRWWLIVAWIALTIVLGLALPSLEWQRAVAELRRVQVGWLVVAIVLNFLILPLWALEWRLLVPATRVPVRRMFGVVSITASVLNTVPFLAGEASAVALLITRARLARGAALSVLAMDQLLVAFAKLATLAAAAWLAPIPDWLRRGLASVVVVFGLMLGTLLVLAHRWQALQARLVPTRSALDRLAARLLSWGAHLDVLRAPGRIARAAELSLAKKTAELLAIVAVQSAFGLAPSLSSGVLVLAGLALSTLVPVSPGNLGVYEATVFALYRVAGVEPELALGLAIVQHLCFLLPSLATGYVTLTLEVRPRPAA